MPQDDQNRQVNLDEWEKLTFEKYGVPENLRQSIVGQESGGDVNAKSPTGVSGKYQVTKATASQYGYDRDDQWQQPVAAAKHLRTLYNGVKQRHPDFDDKTAWLGASAEYYYGGNAFDKDGNLSDQSRDGYSTPAKYAQGIAEKWSAFDKGAAPTPQPSQAEQMSRGVLPGTVEPVSRPKPAPKPLTARDKAVYGQSALQALRDPYAAEKAQFEQLPLLDRTLQRGGDALMRGVGQMSRMARQATQAGTAINRKLGLPAPPNDDALEAWKQKEEEQRQFYEQRRVRRPSSLGTDIAEGIVEAVPAAGAAIGGTVLTGGGLPAAALIGGGMGAAGADWNDPTRAATQTALGAVAPIVGGRIGAKAGEALASRLANPTARALAAGGGELAGGAAGNVIGSGAEQLVFEGRVDPRELVKQAVIGAAMNAPGAVGAGRAARAPRIATEAPGVAPDAAGTPVNGVRVFRQGEQILARARNERQIAIDLTKPDGSVETVMAIAPRGMNEADIRTAAEQAANPPEQAAPTFDDVISDSQSRIQQSLAAGDTNAADIELSVFDQSIKDQYSEALKAAKGNPAARAAAQRVRAQQLRGADGLKQQVEARKQQLQQPTEELQQVPPDPTAELTARIADAADTQQFRTPEGAIIAGPSSLPSRRLLNPAPPDPETQQIPGVPRTIQAADEPTGRFQTGRLPVATENAPTMELPIPNRRTAETLQQPAINRPETGPTIPQRQQVQRRTATLPRSPVAAEQSQDAPTPTVAPDMLAATQEPTNRIVQGEGSELPRRASRPIEGQPVELPRPAPNVPRATDANIAELEAGYEQMLRAKHDKGAPLTGEIAGEEQALGAEIYRYRNERSPRGETEPMSSAIGGRQRGPTIQEQRRRRAGAARALATEEPTSRVTEGAGAELQRYSRPLEGQPIELPRASTPGRKVTQEVQIPSARDPRTDFSSREDARQGHFDQFDDTELVAEIRRMEEIQNQAVGGRSKLTREELEANRFDHKIAVEMQKERGRMQKMMGVDEANRIAPRTPGVKKTPRVIQHEQFGEVTEAADQKGVPRGKLRVIGAGGKSHEIQNPRTKGNRSATFVKATETPTPTPRRGAQGPAVDAPISMQASGKPPATRQQAQFEGEAAEYTDRKDRYKRQNVYEIEMTEGAFKGQKRWIKEAPSKETAAPAGNQIVRKMLEIKPASRSGAPVQIAELRKRLNLPKEQFDAEISKLADADRITLARHDAPQSLSEAERSNLVKIGNDYFTAAAIVEGKGHVMGMGFGSLQGLFKGRKAPSANPSSADIEGASLGNAIGNIVRTGFQGLRTIKTSFDLSAPFGQAAFLTIPHPLKSARSFGQMLRSLKPSQSDAIDAEIAFHPLRKLGEEAGLYLATSAKLKGDASGGEEAFMVKGLNRVPGIGASERTYRTYLDTLRMSVWEGYVKSLQADGYTWENNPKAYKDAAAGINIASGRGSIKKGGKIEKAMDLGGDILFSPRNFVAKFQRLDPVRYAALAPGARKLVLRDALTTFGVMLGTAALLKARGANISLNPEDDNFMVAKLGDTRYDLTVGAKTQVQFLARMAMGAYRKKTGEGNLPYKDPLSVAASFMRNQLAPGPSFAMEAFGGVDAKGEKLSDKSPGKIAREVVAPMMVDDFYEAYEKEGKAGVAKTLPAIVGARVSNYPNKAKAAFLDAPAELRAEQKQAGMTRSLLTPKKGEANNKADDETPAQFAARKSRADEWTTKYGAELVGSQAYKSASTEEKKAALEYVKRTIAGQSDEKRPSLYLLRPAQILATIRQSARKKKRKAARAGE